MIKIKDILTLEDDREYVVSSKSDIDGFTYIYLVDINNHANIKFCKIIFQNDSLNLIEITDDETLKKVMPILASSIIEEIS